MSDVAKRQCEGCHGSGTNWDCGGENAPENCSCAPDGCSCQTCTCESCTGDPGCQECDEGDVVRAEARETADEVER